MNRSAQLFETLEQAQKACEVLERLYRQAEALHTGLVTDGHVDCQITWSDLRKGLYAATAIRESVEALKQGVTSDIQLKQDAHRYQWLFGARSEAQCTDENVGLQTPLPQDLVIAQIATTYLHKEAVDSMIDQACSESQEGCDD